MSQSNRLNIHVIKTKRIECGKLDLPAMLTQPRELTPTRNNSSTPRSKALSFQTSSQDHRESHHHRESDSLHSSTTDSLFSQTEDILSAPEEEEDAVFEGSFETPSKALDKPIKCGARCLSLPACLGAETEGDDAQQSVRLRPRRLLEEALNLEQFQSRAYRRETYSVRKTVGEENQTDWHEFPRKRELGVGQEEKDNELMWSRTPHAVTVNEHEALGLITDYNNNDYNSLQQNGFVENTIRRRSHSSFDLRRDWEQKILGLTGSETDFGTERGGGGVGPDERRSRPRSVTLTGSVYAFVKAREKVKARDTERRARSESKRQGGMPKLQTVVWDYIKRRSSKRKEKRDGEAKGNSKQRQSVKHSTRNGAESSVGSESGNTISHHPNGRETSKNASTNSVKAVSLGKWKSSPNLCYSEATEYAERILQRKNSLDELNSRKAGPETPAKEATAKEATEAKELKEDPEILRLLLTTNSELRPMEERLKTLTMSREWLLKELKGLRQDDRRLARQFINLRSAIMEIRQAREEKEDSDYDSDGEEKKSKHRIDSKRLAADQERHINDHGYHMHDTPTRNILSYC